MSIRDDERNLEFPASIPDLIHSMQGELTGGSMDRRRFLQGLALLLTLAETMPLAAQDRPGAVAKGGDRAGSVEMTRDPWLTLTAVQSHLFPTDEDSPGAADIHATTYLRNALADPVMNPASRDFILNGVGWLNDTSNQRHREVFVRLDESGREDVLQYIAKSQAGERWLSLLLLYIFEALLADPFYGGNPGAIGWRWLEHQPGFPQPDMNNSYRVLAEK